MTQEKKEPEVQEEEQEDIFGGRPPYQSFTCEVCVHLSKEGACRALPPSPVLHHITESHSSPKLATLTGESPKVNTEMTYIAVYPTILNPSKFPACSLFIYDKDKAEALPDVKTEE